MKTQTAQLNFLRMAPRKVRSVANTVKTLSVNEAEARLLTNPKRAAEPILKLLRSAVANAKHNQQLEPGRLFIKEIRVDQCPMLKRWMPRARGQASMIQKKGSHITLVLAESDKLKPPRFKIVKPERIKKSEMKKIRKQKEKEIEKPKETTKIEIKPSKGPEFIKRMFRRKAV